MAFIGIILMLFPFLAAIIGVLLVFLYFMAFCLVLIGVSGIVMNKLNTKQVGSVSPVVKPWLNNSAILAGVLIVLSPFGVILFKFISLLFR